jgi:hypothetical protein
MKEVNDPWGITAKVRYSLRTVELLVASLEENARIIQPLITDSDTAKVLLGLKNCHCPGVLMTMCSIERETEHIFVAKPLESLLDLRKDAKYLFVWPAGLSDELRELDIQTGMLRDRAERAETVFKLADEKIFAFALAAAASRSK